MNGNSILLFEDDSGASKMLPSIGDLTDGVLARLQGNMPKAEAKRDWFTVPTPRPITDEKMQHMYAIIYHGFMARYKLERVEVPLFAVIIAAARSEKEGWCYMSQASLAKLCGVSIPTVRDGLKHLNAKGLLERGRFIRGETVHLRLSPQARKEWEGYRSLIEGRKNNRKRV